MSLSQTMPPNYQSLLYPNTGTNLPQQTVLPAELAHGTGGNAADYMSKAVGGSRYHHRRRRQHRKTIIRMRSRSGKTHKRKRAGKGHKTRKLRRRA